MLSLLCTWQGYGVVGSTSFPIKVHATFVGASPGALAQVVGEEGEDVDEMEVEDEEEETVTVPDQKDDETMVKGGKKM